ncbi:MAG: hypothetical protein ACJ74O_15820 [Frankiaceae bacterium]
MLPLARRAAATAYVLAVVALAASAFADRDAAFGWAEGSAMLLTLPAIVVALPAIYVVGAALWSITDAADGGPMWPVTLAYALMLGGTAVGNLWLLHRLSARRRRPAAPSATAPSATAPSATAPNG